MMRRERFPLLLLGAALFAHGGCSSDDAMTTQPCTPNQSVECTCGLGVRGAQTCNSAGSGFGACSCANSASTTDAGTSSGDPDGGISESDAGCNTTTPAPTNTLTATVHGTPFTAKVPDSEFNAYDLSRDSTTLRLSTIATHGGGPGPGLDGAIQISFHGKTTGTFDCLAVGSSVLYTGTKSAGGTGFYAVDMGGTCTITVTEYGCIGGAIRGTFSATVTQDDASSQVFPGEASVTITQGVFDVARSPDSP